MGEQYYFPHQHQICDRIILWKSINLPSLKVKININYIILSSCHRNSSATRSRLTYNFTNILPALAFFFPAICTCSIPFIENLNLIVFISIYFMHIFNKRERINIKSLLLQNSLLSKVFKLFYLFLLCNS